MAEEPSASVKHRDKVLTISSFELDLKGVYSVYRTDVGSVISLESRPSVHTGIGFMYQVTNTQMWFGDKFLVNTKS